MVQEERKEVEAKAMVRKASIHLDDKISDMIADIMEQVLINPSEELGKRAFKEMLIEI